MQFLLNIIFKLLSFVFTGLGSISFPDWIPEIVSTLSCYISVINYYVPLSTFFSVALIVVGVQIVLMVVSALLQLL